ncbi:hypothetical protein GCM10007387_46380 [Pseudoduganella albidiflava]|nr:hypothetical protein GCM10007387_46380 [Pseudoduganella albidiflava]
MTHVLTLMRWFLALGRLCLLVLITLSIPPLASAATITYGVTQLDGDRWQYEYVISAHDPGFTIEEFTIFFSTADFANLSMEAAPEGWDAIAIQPDPSLPAEGYFDALATGPGLAAGMTAGVFRVSFDFLGTGSPVAQRFAVVDPFTFDVLASGMTSPVPEPRQGQLLALGLGSFVALHCARRRLGFAGHGAGRSS